MTAQSSAKSGGVFYKFLPYYLNKLKFLKPQIIMNCIFSLLSYPLFLGFLNGYCSAEINRSNIQQTLSQLQIAGDYTATEAEAAALRAAQNTSRTMESLTVMGAIIGIICLVGLFVFTIVTTRRAFRYLYDKNAVDMDYSLPVNHNTRFFADLAAVFTTSIIPHLIAVLIGLILLQCFSGQMLGYEPDWVQTSKLCCSIASQCMFTGIFACIMQIGFTMLMISVCGKKAESGLYPVLLNIAVPVIHVLCVAIVELSVYGSNGSFNYLSAVSTSPVGMITLTMTEAIRYLTGTRYDIYDMASSVTDRITMPVFQPLYGIIALLLTLAFLVGAYFLMKHRRTERVGMPYVYKGMSLVIPGVIILNIALPICNVIFAVFRNTGNEDVNSYTPNPVGLIVGLLISTFIVYVIMELISGRAFRRFHITVAKWAGTVAVCAGIAAVLTYSNGFGLAYYVPDPGSVAEATIDVYGYDRSMNYDYGYYVGSTFHVGYNNDPEIIKTITDIHKQIPKDGKATDYLGTGYVTTGNSGSVSIIYKLKNGGEVGRSYPINSAEEIEKYLRAVITPETWYEKCIGYQLSSMSVKPENTEVISVDWENQFFMTRNLKLTELAEKIKQDSRKITYELAVSGNGVKEYSIGIDYRTRQSTSEGHFSYDKTMWITIYSWMDETLAYLESCGVIFDYSVYKTAYLLKSNDGESIYRIMPEVIMALDEGVTSEESEKKYGVSFDDVDFNYSFVKLDRNSVACRQLLESASTSEIMDRFAMVLLAAESYDEYFTDNNSYVLLGVPNESYTLAEKLFSERSAAA